MPRRHWPLGAVYQSEAAAAAILRVAEEAPREIWVGLPAMESILGTVVAPAMLDRYRAATAYEQQMAPGPVASGNGDILYAPATHDHGVRGRYAEHANPHAVDADPMALRRGGLALAVAAFGLALSGATHFVSPHGAAGRRRMVRSH